MRCFALVLLAACAPATATTEQPVIGGALAPNDTSTVLLVSYPGDKSVQDNCSAVVVSSTMLLTAAHCVDAANHPGYTYGVFVDADASIYPRLVDILPHLLAVSAVHPHPTYTTDEADIAIVVLASPVAIAPLPIARMNYAATIANKPARIAGYGQTTSGVVNQVRYAAATSVMATSGDDTVIVGDATAHDCVGDSGGPAIVDGMVVGVDSHGPAGCTGPSFFRRTDVYASFIEQYVPAPVTGVDAGVSGPESGVDLPPDTGNGGGGGCATTTSSSPWLLLALVPLLRRRRS